MFLLVSLLWGNSTNGVHPRHLNNSIRDRRTNFVRNIDQIDIVVDLQDRFTIVDIQEDPGKCPNDNEKEIEIAYPGRCFSSISMIGDY